MIKTIRLMLIPNDKQRTRLFQFAGTARFAFNWALEQEKRNYDAGDKFINDYELRRRFTEFKQEPSNRWLYTISNNVCKQAIKDAVDAYRKSLRDWRDTRSTRASNTASLVFMLTQQR